MELNAEQIKKVLLHCANWTVETGCKGCPYDGDCIDKDVMKDALALITSQEQRIKELTEKEKKSDRVFSDLYKEAETYLAQRECLQNQVKNLTEENERLRAEVADLQDELKCEKETNEHLCGEYMSAKADTVRKMQKRITVHATNGYPRKVRLDVIDQIAKEMVEGKQ